VIRASKKNLEQHPSATVSDRPIPAADEINAQEEFRAQKFSAHEFDEAWRAAAGGGRRRVEGRDADKLCPLLKSRGYRAQ
jgi:hypothetical protein